MISSSSPSRLLSFYNWCHVSYTWRVLSYFLWVVLCMCWEGGDGVVERVSSYYLVGRLSPPSVSASCYYLGFLNLFSSVSVKKLSPARWTTEDGAGEGADQPILEQPSFWLTACALSPTFTAPGAFSSWTSWVLRHKGLTASAHSVCRWKVPELSAMSLTSLPLVDPPSHCILLFHFVSPWAERGESIVFFYSFTKI